MYSDFNPPPPGGDLSPSKDTEFPYWFNVPNLFAVLLLTLTMVNLTKLVCICVCLAGRIDDTRTMSDRMRFGFGGSSQYLQQQHQHQQKQQYRCTLCLDDDRNVTGGVCQHTASVESALSYLRNFGASVGGGHHQQAATPASSSSYGGGGVSSPMYHHGPQSPYDAVASTLQGAFGAIGGGAGGRSSPPVSPNNCTLIEYLLALRVQQEQQQNGYHGRPHHGRAPPAGRPPKPKSEMGCLRECAFCKSNGETAEFYKSHFLKDPVGRVRCPILQRYVFYIKIITIIIIIFIFSCLAVAAKRPCRLHGSL